MFELFLVVGVLLGVSLLGVLTVAITPRIMVELGLWVLAGGLFVGIPTGLWYHVALYRALAGRMRLPPRWWRTPVEAHPLLTPQEFRRVQPWFVAGAVGFFLCCLGGVAAIVGLSLLRLYR
jgi:hypothetical protein